ncbi:sulfotransferase [Oceaniovalibus sp. ACAM 378]|uniref:sulfotransferase n=1 Tax=Oceaniovalibus sp. ACAM 378 TaxID=2599923 RepID=UPI0011DBA5F8|nr:sulfotransferase [Oceaniovalibus sp. ACAM 378]TYB84068.1 sulfotransferase [Oceaniovalibus sp. ACAM 378]
MVRKLDFIVFGMPRGGTSAVARYISAVEPLHCGQEVMTISTDHSTLDIPDAFLTPVNDRWNDSSVAAVTANRDRIRLYGNKTPTYFYRLNGVLAELDNAPAIACIRDPHSVALSYSTRASNTKDRWNSGRRGLFAVGDALMLVHALHHAPQDAKILIMPQKALLADWRKAMSRAIEHIAPGVAPEFGEQALAEIDHIKTRQTRRDKVELEKIEQRALNRLDRIGLTALFDRDTVCDLDDIREDLARIVADGPGNAIGFIRKLAVDHPDELARNFADRWVNPAKRAWQGFNGGGAGGSAARNPAQKPTGTPAEDPDGSED